MWVSYAAAVAIPSIRDMLLLSAEGRRAVTPLAVSSFHHTAFAFAFCGFAYLVANNDSNRRTLFRVNVLIASLFTWTLYGSPFYASFDNNILIVAQTAAIALFAAKFGFA